MRAATRFAVILALGAAVLAGVVYFKQKDRHQAGEERSLADLQRLAEQEMQDTAAAADAYTPTVAGKIDDLAVPAQPILAQMPGVVRVDVPVPVENPTSRIVHVLDWHFVPKDLYALDLRSASEKPLTDQEIDARHEKLLVEVELVQMEQVALLRCLIRHHGLRRIFCEGLTEKDLPAFKARVEVLRGTEKQLPTLRRQKEEVDEILQSLKMAKKEDTERYRRAAAVAGEIDAVLAQHRLEILGLGALARLLASGEIEEVLPLDDPALLEQAKPVSPDGKVRLDLTKVQARQDAQVRAALARGPFALIILGGAHDLSDSVKRMTGGSCEYIRVTTKWYAEFSGGRPK